MKKNQERILLRRDERLRESLRQGTSMNLPLAVHHRLDLLTEAAEDAQPTRAEIIGMLIAFAELDPERLESEVLRYRKLTVGDVIPAKPEPEPERQPEPLELDEFDNVVSIRKRGPGRPARHEAG